MNRRTFLATSSAAALIPALANAGVMQYSPGLVDKELAAGKTVFVDFTASWCSTCAAQRRVLAKLKKANPAYEQNVVFVDVDWDQYGKGELSQRLQIPRRSTLVVLKGDQELGRIVAGTREADIQQLMDTALAAASA